MRSSGVVLNNATIEGSGMLMAAGTIATTVTVTPAAGLTLTLANSLSGPGQLIENGQGTLLLTGSNSYGGGTTIASGTLQVGNGGSGASLGGGPVADNGALVFNHADNVAFSPAVSGNGSLTQTGSGVLTLLASNTYTARRRSTPARSRWATAAAARRSAARASCSITAALFSITRKLDVFAGRQRQRQPDADGDGPLGAVGQQHLQRRHDDHAGTLSVASGVNLGSATSPSTAPATARWRSPATVPSTRPR